MAGYWLYGPIRTRPSCWLLLPGQEHCCSVVCLSGRHSWNFVLLFVRFSRYFLSWRQSHGHQRCSCEWMTILHWLALRWSHLNLLVLQPEFVWQHPVRDHLKAPPLWTDSQSETASSHGHQVDEGTTEYGLIFLLVHNIKQLPGCISAWRYSQIRLTSL